MVSLFLRRTNDMTIYIVNWARAIGGDGTPVDAFTGCAGAFIDRKQAEACLEREVESLLADFRSMDDLDDRMLFEQSLRIDRYDCEFVVEIDYTAPDGSDVEWYFTINEEEVEM
jgi:hypothetical protein